MSSLQANTAIVKNKVGLLNLAEELGNIAQACRVMGVSRDTFYRYQKAKEQGGLEGLLQKSRKAPNLKNRIDPAIEKEICDLAIEEPAWGQLRVSNELRKKGMVVSAAGVRGAWLRNGLENFKKRLRALEEKMAKEGGPLTESQLQAMEKRKAEQEVSGEIETEHPGYLGSQDTMYVGALKGVGRVYQQTFVDTYSRLAHAKLYTAKNALTAADMLNDKVIPFYQEQGVPLLRVLTDRGTEYCGKVEQHDYQLYLAIQDIDHTRTKTKHPQTNGICERFHKTIIDEFYNKAFRKKLYESIEQLQDDLEKYLLKFNYERPHQGKRCDGKTPWETFESGKQILEEKIISGDLKKEEFMN